MKDAKAILIEEIELLTDWEVAAEDVNNNIDAFSIEELKAIAAFQKIFVADLDALKTTAEEFFLQQDENKWKIIYNEMILQ